MSARDQLDLIRSQLDHARAAKLPGDALARLIDAEIQAHLDAVDEAQAPPGLHRGSRLGDRPARRPRRPARRDRPS